MQPFLIKLGEIPTERSKNKIYSDSMRECKTLISMYLYALSIYTW